MIRIKLNDKRAIDVTTYKVELYTGNCGYHYVTEKLGTYENHYKVPFECIGTITNIQGLNQLREALDGRTDIYDVTVDDVIEEVKKGLFPIKYYKEKFEDNEDGFHEKFEWKMIISLDDVEEQTE